MEAQDVDVVGFMRGSVWAVTEDGVITAVYVMQMKGDLGGMPTLIAALFGDKIGV